VPRRLARAVVGVLAVIATLAGLPQPGGAATLHYVSLGDSYTAASGVTPLAHGVDPFCLQSTRNYPKLTAAALGLALTDVSCGGATVGNMTASQYSDQPPQFDALGPDVSVVTLGIGGNDNALFLSAVAECGTLGILDPLQLGAPCTGVYGSYFANLIDKDAAKIATALRQIHQLAPGATVFVIGYGEILPHTTGCYPRIPVVRGDVPYLDGIERHLNSMLAQQAAANDATYVDVYANSAGHDACKPVGVRWIEPPLSGQPIHPNAIGEAATARLVTAALHSHGVA